MDAGATTSRFVFTFNEAFNVAACKDPSAEADLLSCLTAAKHTTQDEYAAVWNDAAKMKLAISWFLYVDCDGSVFGTTHCCCVKANASSNEFSKVE